LAEGRVGLLADEGGVGGQLDRADRSVRIGSQRGPSSVARFAGPDELVLARSPFGGRPLFYATHPANGTLLACSELAPIVSALGGRVTVNQERIAATVLNTTLADPGETHFRQIRRVPSSCELRFTLGAGVCHRPLAFDSRPNRAAPVEELAAELRVRILESVAGAVEGASRVGVLVSGGLDSSVLLAATLAVVHRATDRVDAFNFAFAGRGDDRPHFAALCDRLGVHPLCVRPEECASRIQELLVIDAAPTGWPTAACEIALARMNRQRGGSVLLTGSGGDEVFEGDTRVFAHRARRGHLLSSLRCAARLHGSWLPTAASRMRSLVLRPLLKRAVPAALARRIGAVRQRRRVPRWAGPAARRLVENEAFERGSGVDEGEDPNRCSWLANAARCTPFLEYSEARAQLELAGGCPLADPFLDERVVDFMASLRPDLPFCGHWTRGLFRQAVRGWIPESVRLRTDKASFAGASRELLEAPGGLAALEPLLRATALADLGIVEPRPFAECVANLRQATLDDSFWFEIWPVLAAEAFVRQASGQ
jgi:asparagine synthase (glutamine-hydrolysing)